jgi:soluble lytic murein transglycosylase-like protein
VVLGSTIQIPSEAEAASALAGTGTVTTTASAPADPAAPEPMGGYTVQPGETLSGIAAAAGVGVEQLAWMNGLDPAGVLVSGTALKLPGQTGAPAAPPQEVPDAAPYATPGTTNSSEISQIAGQNGVSGSLASAVAWQESGFNNAAVSSANARGVMQVMPGTWDWIEENLSGPLDPNSTQDNIKAGSLYLNQLLQDTGGDERMAVAAYYQGLGSVQEQGLYPETEQYVENVMALKGRFGG